ncbi:MAG: IS21 family transposase [Spirochaetaceae bacterium]|nr:MAG: IS21 family transposase [Spirochaetaceae bacterium]
MAGENCTLGPSEDEAAGACRLPEQRAASRAQWSLRRSGPMHGREKRVLLREYLKDGWSKADLARRFGVSRRVIYYWIGSGQLDRELDGQAASYTPRPPVASKIDPFTGIILSRLEEFPKLSAVRLFDEIREAGYQGSYTQVKEYVRRVRPRAEVEPVVRFETPPGRQAQVDFAHFNTPWGKRWALVVVLGYSRFMWVGFFARQTMENLIRGIEAAFAYFGGVAEELLFDQMRAVIVEDQRSSGGRLIENIEFLRFAAHWGFKTRACRPYRAQTKGKVERPIRYLRENFFYGRHFLNDQDLEAQLAGWLDTKANVRVHGTTGLIPAEQLASVERAVLGPLATRPYQSLVPAKPSAVKPLLTTSIVVERRPLAIYSQVLGDSA